MITRRNHYEQNQEGSEESGGFTLIEMLIVVAIIAILVAISIPLVNSSLEKARVATDDANERAAKAAALLDYMSDPQTKFTDTNLTHIYDAENGNFANIPAKGYGKCKDHRNYYIKVTINNATESKVTTEWVASTS